MADRRRAGRGAEAADAVLAEAVDPPAGADDLAVAGVGVPVLAARARRRGSRRARGRGRARRRTAGARARARSRRRRSRPRRRRVPRAAGDLAPAPAPPRGDRPASGRTELGSTGATSRVGLERRPPASAVELDGEAVEGGGPAVAGLGSADRWPARRPGGRRSPRPRSGVARARRCRGRSGSRAAGCGTVRVARRGTRAGQGAGSDGRARRAPTPQRRRPARAVERRRSSRTAVTRIRVSVSQVSSAHCGAEPLHAVRRSVGESISVRSRAVAPTLAACRPRRRRSSSASTST